LDVAVWARIVGSGGVSWNPFSELEKVLGETINRAEIRARRKARFAELMATQSAHPASRNM